MAQTSTHCRFRCCFNIETSQIARWFGFLVICIVLSSAAQANEKFLGDWAGSFECDADRNIKMNLKIDTVKDGRLAGVFEFRARLNHASYKVIGTATASGAFELKPGAWLKHPSGFRASGLQGQLFRFGNKDGMRGTLSECRKSHFVAVRKPRIETTPPPAVAKSRERDINVLTKAVRAGIRELSLRRDRNRHWWNKIEHSVIFSRLDRKAKDALLAEIEDARADVEARALLDELAAGPKEYPKAIGRALHVLGRAKAAKWPDKVLRRVHDACEKQVAVALRPKLEQAAAMAATLPSSLEGLISARAALAPVEDYRASLTRAFGTLDPEGILKPVLRRLAEIEADPAVSAALRSELAAARRDQDPRGATESVLFRVLGSESAASPLAAVAAEGRDLAAIAAIVVEDQSPQLSDSLEPSADDIAIFAHARAREMNKLLAGLRCKRGAIDDPITFAKCLLGESEFRVERIVKTGCVSETPGQQYNCSYFQGEILVIAQTGKPLPLQRAFETIYGQLFGGSPSGGGTARFLRTSGLGEEGWIVKWGRLSVRIGKRR